jgi:hypothetical protein
MSGGETGPRPVFLAKRTRDPEIGNQRLTTVSDYSHGWGFTSSTLRGILGGLELLELRQITLRLLRAL